MRFVQSACLSYSRTVGSCSYSRFFEISDNGALRYFRPANQIFSCGALISFKMCYSLLLYVLYPCTKEWALNPAPQWATRHLQVSLLLTKQFFVFRYRSIPSYVSIGLVVLQCCAPLVLDSKWLWESILCKKLHLQSTIHPRWPLVQFAASADSAFWRHSFLYARFSRSM